MALGQSYDNNKDKKQKSVTLYSQVIYGNQEGFDPSIISVSYWNKLMKISISPRKGEEWDHENAIAVNLTYLKAKQLADEIEIFKQNPEMYQNVGVTAGAGLISLSNGIEFTGKTTPCIVIRKINESGGVDAAIAYELKNDYHYSVRNFEEKNGKFDKIYNNTLELDTLQMALYEYYNAMSGAIAYSVMEYGKYDTSRMNTKLDSICEKLGVSYGEGKSNSQSKPRSSVFDKAAGRGGYNDIDDIG